MGSPIRRTILLVILSACVAIAAAVYLQLGTPASRGPASPEQAIIAASRGLAGDADLGALFAQLNAQHFGGRLPNVNVLWSGDLDRLDAGDYRLNGMTDGKIILLKAALQAEDAEARRTLCHEMVHVKFLAEGQRSTAHDAPFQTELRRIFEGGCFEALWAPPEEKAALGAWLDAERSRLDGARLYAEAQLAAITLETERVEGLVSALNERIRLANAAGSGWPSPEEAEAAEQQRRALQESIVAYNSAVADNEQEQARFNEAVARHNLMMVYPDGLAEDRAKGLIR